MKDLSPNQRRRDPLVHWAECVAVELGAYEHGPHQLSVSYCGQRQTSAASSPSGGLRSGAQSVRGDKPIYIIDGTSSTSSTPIESSVGGELTGGRPMSLSLASPYGRWPSHQALVHEPHQRVSF